MNLKEKIDSMLRLPEKNIISETEFKKGQKLVHIKGAGGTAFFVRDLGNGKIEIERERDLKKFKVPAKEWGLASEHRPVRLPKKWR